MLSFIVHSFAYTLPALSGPCALLFTNASRSPQPPGDHWSSILEGNEAQRGCDGPGDPVRSRIQTSCPGSGPGLLELRHILPQEAAVALSSHMVKAGGADCPGVAGVSCWGLLLIPSLAGPPSPFHLCTSGSSEAQLKGPLHHSAASLPGSCGLRAPACLLDQPLGVADTSSLLQASVS